MVLDFLSTLTLNVEWLSELIDARDDKGTKSMACGFVREAVDYKLNSSTNKLDFYRTGCHRQ